MAFIKREDLYFGRQGVVARAQAGLIMGLLGINKLNRLHDDVTEDGSIGNVAENALRRLGVTVSSSEWDMSNIPAEGGCIVVANHPTGALDGILLISELSKVRKEFRVMSNFLLSRIPELKHYFIDVDPFDDNGGRNVSGMKRALEYVASGGMLVMFPAGEVSTWRKGFRNVADKPWSASIVRFMRKAGAPIVPVYIGASNSLLFHLAGKVHPLLRTAMLPRELLNKRGKNVSLRIATPVDVKRFDENEEPKLLGNFLRANIYYMAPERVKKRVLRRSRKCAVPEADDVIGAVGGEVLGAEIDSIRAEHRIFEYGDFEVFFSHPSHIPHMMTEIGRQREITFREVGEGTNKHIDTDSFDEYYYQLFVWDKVQSRLVGAYRMGMGGEIMKRFGLEGFYSNTLFRMAEPMGEIMSKTIEMGRSFIVSDYQRKPASLLLLWKGILYVLLKHEDYRYLLGPVSVSGEMKENSKLVIVAYLKGEHADKKEMSYIKPVTGFDTRAKIDESLIKGIKSIDLINKLVVDIERGEFAVPVLVKKYLQLNSRVLGFNTDHDFCDSLDTMILLDLKKVPENIILMVSKELKGTDIDVMARFRHIE